MDAGEVFEAEFLGAVRAVPHTRLLHPSLRLFADLARWAEPAAGNRITL
jgi:hypothetical protein